MARRAVVVSKKTTGGGGGSGGMSTLSKIMVFIFAVIVVLIVLAYIFRDRIIDWIKNSALKGFLDSIGLGDILSIGDEFDDIGGEIDIKKDDKE